MQNQKTRWRNKFTLLYRQAVTQQRGVYAKITTKRIHKQRIGLGHLFYPTGKTNMFNWSSFRDFGKSNLVKSSLYWIFLIPIVAKSLKEIPSIMPGYEAIVNIPIPFSWYILYFSGVFFSIGLVVYNICCPRIILKYSDFNDFLKSGGEGFQLIGLSADLKNEVNQDGQIFESLKSTLKKVDPDWNELQQVNAPNLDYFEMKVKSLPSDKLNSIFYAIYNEFEIKNKTSRLICIGLFIIGILLLAIVFFQNINLVVVFMIGGPLIDFCQIDC